jgi:hypothetical protein
MMAKICISLTWCPSVGGVSAAVSKTAAAPIERVKLLIQNQVSAIFDKLLSHPEYVCTFAILDLKCLVYSDSNLLCYLGLQLHNPNIRPLDSFLYPQLEWIIRDFNRHTMLDTNEVWIIG